MRGRREVVAAEGDDWTLAVREVIIRVKIQPPEETGMPQDSKSAIDRDCLIAATLAVGGVEQNRSAAYMVQRFAELLKVLRKAGGTSQMWANAQRSEDVSSITVQP